MIEELHERRTNLKQNKYTNLQQDAEILVQYYNFIASKLRTLELLSKYSEERL
jgi:hypothetical protein